MTLLPQVRLRAPEPEDIDLIFDLEEDPRLWEAGTSPAPVSRHMLRLYLDGYRADFSAHGELRMVVEDARGEAVGLVDLFDYDMHNRRAGVGIAILPPKQKQGFGTATLLELNRYVARRLMLHNLWAYTAVDNIAAQKAFERSGYERVGVLKGWTKGPGSMKDVLLWQRRF